MSDSIIGSLWRNAAETGSATALMHKEDGLWQPTTFSELQDLVRSLAAALIGRGIRKGDRIALISETRREWTIADMAVLAAGAATVPVFPTLMPEEVAYILENSGARLVFAEDAAQTRKVLDAIAGAGIGTVGAVVMFSGEPTSSSTPEVLTFEALGREGRNGPDDWRAAVDTVSAGLSQDDLATLVYTSGTTGVPKGVMLTHGNILFNIDSITQRFAPEAGERSVAYLPLAHVYERFSQFCAIHRALPYCFVESLEKLADNLQEIKPVTIPGVPRVYEKLYQRIIEAAGSGPPLKRRLFFWALATGKKMLEVEAQGGTPSPGLRVSSAIADRLVFSKVRAKFGGQVKRCICAAAPVSKDILEFFLALGIPIFEGWGMTETTAPGTINFEGFNRVGTVGMPLPGVEIRIAADGEVLARGGSIFKGYWEMPDDTAETLVDGWLHTGDLGVLDGDGYLSITGRKKELIITSGGKNIAPAAIEGLFDTDSLIGHLVVYGDNRKYLTAIVSLDPEGLEKFTSVRGIAAGENGGDYATLTTHPEVVEEVRTSIDRRNENLPPFMTVKAFHLLDHEISIESGELTPTLKVKKNVLFDRYTAELENMYENGGIRV